MAKQLTVKTKLQERASPSQAPVARRLLSTVKTYPRSYRWREQDVKLIDALMARVNGISGRRIDATKLIRGALHLAEKQQPERILQSIVEAESRSLTCP